MYDFQSMEIGCLPMGNSSLLITVKSGICSHFGEIHTFQCLLDSKYKSFSLMVL